LSSVGKKTARFLLAGACDSYVPYIPYGPNVPYVRCVGWKPRFSCRCKQRPEDRACPTKRSVFYSYMYAGSYCTYYSTRSLMKHLRLR